MALEARPACLGRGEPTICTPKEWAQRVNQGGKIRHACWRRTKIWLIGTEACPRPLRTVRAQRVNPLRRSRQTRQVCQTCFARPSRLTDAAVPSLSLESRFDLAYNAARVQLRGAALAGFCSAIFTSSSSSAHTLGLGPEDLARAVEVPRHAQPPGEYGRPRCRRAPCRRSDCGLPRGCGEVHALGPVKAQP